MQTHKFLLLFIQEQEAIIGKHDNLLNRNINEIDSYQQAQDQDFSPFKLLKKKF